VNLGGTLNVDNTAALGGIVNDRLGGKDLTLAGTFNYVSGTGATSDHIGTLNVAGHSTIALTHNAVGSTVVNLDTLTRQPGSTLALTGRTFGAAPGVNVTNLTVAANGNGAAAIGGTGLAGSTTISINPFVLSTDAALTGNARFGFVTNQINGVMLTDGF